MQPEAQLLEVGAGTGKATLPLAQRGFSIKCLEMGKQLAEVARRNLGHHPNVEIVVTSFEDWQPRGERFDLVFAATAWHWLDPATRYSKAAGLLTDKGVLAFFSAKHAFPADTDRFFYEIQDVYEALEHGGNDLWFPGYDHWPPPPPQEVADDSDEIVASGFFDDIQVRRYTWAHEYTADQYVALLNTFSGHIMMDHETREFLYAEIRRRINDRRGKKVRRHWLAILHVAHRL